MGDDAEHRIVVEKEGIGFPAWESASRRDRKWVLSHDLFRFCRDLVFLRRSWSVRATSPVFLSRSTNRSISPYVMPNRAPGREPVSAASKRIVATYSR